MAGKPAAPSGPAPGEDPYEFNWPDDAREQRALDRAKALKDMARPRAPRVFTMVVLCIATVLGFLFAAALSASYLPLFFGMAPVIIGMGIVVGAPLIWGLDRVTRKARTGIAETAFLVVGGTVGYMGTVLYLNLNREYLAADDLDAFLYAKATVPLYMLTAVAAGFLIARTTVDTFSKFHRIVFIAAGLIGALLLAGLATIFFPRS